MESRGSENRSVRTLEAQMQASSLENTELGYLTVVANSEPWAQEDRLGWDDTYFLIILRKLFA